MAHGFRPEHCPGRANQPDLPQRVAAGFPGVAGDANLSDRDPFTGRRDADDGNGAADPAPLREPGSRYHDQFDWMGTIPFELSPNVGSGDLVAVSDLLDIVRHLAQPVTADGLRDPSDGSRAPESSAGAHAGDGHML
ncbi:hypothetical protein H9L14_05900 [Sphingomonas sediminicola]|uniref:Uncharacterized protein n=1 Tax=Sphingomonas sediminicola TaxID=386874 RepID=A0ABX6TB87_9SPHN|nr:hypothetical protein [Sphingomonas sediminicola]QNP46634.1 hypothetical protein H9L14_05900 [Sphingomonas sediminicola]